MSKLSYRLIKVCYPIALIPINNFFLDMLTNNCGCPKDHIAIYLLQSINWNGKSYFFFNYSQALKKYKLINEITNKDDNDINENDDIFILKVEIDNNFNYQDDDITTYDFFDVGCINLPSYLKKANIESLTDSIKKELKDIIAHVKEDSYYIYDKVKAENVILKNTLDQLTLNINNSKDMKLN